jgi:hypothetical protein
MALEMRMRVGNLDGMVEVGAPDRAACMPMRCITAVERWLS